MQAQNKPEELPTPNWRKNGERIREGCVEEMTSSEAYEQKPFQIEKIGGQDLVAEELQCYGLNVVCICSLKHEPTIQREDGNN